MLCCAAGGAPRNAFNGLSGCCQGSMPRSERVRWFLRESLLADSPSERQRAEARAAFEQRLVRLLRVSSRSQNKRTPSARGTRSEGTKRPCAGTGTGSGALRRRVPVPVPVPSPVPFAALRAPQRGRPLPPGGGGGSEEGARLPGVVQQLAAGDLGLHGAKRRVKRKISPAPAR